MRVEIMCKPTSREVRKDARLNREAAKIGEVEVKHVELIHRHCIH
jgi:hypothetical protein